MCEIAEKNTKKNASNIKKDKEKDEIKKSQTMDVRKSNIREKSEPSIQQSQVKNSTIEESRSFKLPSINQKRYGDGKNILI